MARKNAVPRILVVDDDPHQVAMLESMLSQAGYQVVSASSSREALEALGRTGVDLALLDVVIDEMDGFEICRRIKENAATRDLPVIFLTGERGSLRMRLKGFEVGAVDYLLKPVTREELLARVKVMLELKAAQDELKDLARNLKDMVEERTAQLKRALEALEEQKAFTENVLKSVPQALFALDRENKLLTWNRVFEETFGVPPSNFPLGELPGLNNLSNLLESGRLKNGMRLPLRRRDGQVRTFHLEVSFLDEGEEDPGRPRVVSLVDVTDREMALGALKGREPAEILKELERLRRELSGRYRMSQVIGFSPSLMEVTRMVDSLRQGRATVLIQGESGTGKELVARALHFDGPHADKPFLPIHCGAISRDLIESELFGHEKGSFTGALRKKVGLFKAADGGTIFLDEVGEISPSSQVKLLRVLQEGTFMPVGSNETIRVDVRVIAATNKILEEEVRAGRFREDLFYRLNVVTIHLPPLRERIDDIPLLVAHFIEKYNVIYGRGEDAVRDVSREVMEILQEYSWPGNVRELENVIVRAFELGCGEVIHFRDLPPYLRERKAPAVRCGAPVDPAPPEKLVEIPRGRINLEDYERMALLAALKKAGGDKVKAARELGIGKSTFYRKLKKLNIT